MSLLPGLSASSSSSAGRPPSSGSAPPSAPHASTGFLAACLLLLTLACLFLYLSRPLDRRTLQPQPIDWRLDINHASASALAELPDIGPALAQRIVDYRRQHGPFTRLQDLQLVSGIGPVIYARIAPYLTCSPAPADSTPSIPDQ